MRILILGAGGMIGHKMYEVLSRTFPETYACVHQVREHYKAFPIFSESHLIPQIDALRFSEVEKVLNEIKPDFVLNCIGVTLRKEKIKDLDYCLELNSLLPQRLRAWCQQKHSHLIHFSTDCVFDGSAEVYTEDSVPSAPDIYGRTKALGEVYGPSALTLRGSMIGYELEGKTELFEWALAQKGKSIKGYSGAWYSGVTTSVMAGLVCQIIKEPKPASGLYQVSSPPISKFDLLQKINQIFQLKMEIKADASYNSKKILDSSKLKRELGFSCPSWDEMLLSLATEKKTEKKD